ncbi:MAG: hydroxyacylglutathione hydrolase [Rhodobacteraceae bacterium]|jgi:hydroxyacylglutathione hydrolase|nr:hydroxyacylglutathione hydrolase [Paracoccaceae bacterium]
MAAILLVVPCLKDNFAFLLHDPQTGATAAVDVPEAAPVAAALAARGWRLTDVLVTHHHGDHVQGLEGLVAGASPRPRVVGAAADAHRLPPLDLAVAPGDRLAVGSLGVDVLDASGHTVGHLAYHVPAAAAAFTGDCLMAMGCGRVFEGTMAMMWASLGRLAALPGSTRILSGHDYLDANAAFARSVEPANAAAVDARLAAARAAGPEGVHVTLDVERATNPFLRAALPAAAAAIGMAGAPAAEVFAELRRRKDRF